MRNHILTLMFLFVFSTPLFADDAVVAVAPGDITFEKNPSIIMQDETLTITKLSQTFLGGDFNIDVDFHFFNTSKQDITRKIVFALPPVSCTEENHSMWEGFDSGSPDEAYLKGLKDLAIFVDGKKVSITQRVVATLGQSNITELLNRLHLPLNPCKIRLTKDGKLDPRYASVLTSNHLLTADNSAAWSENIYFEWTQVFPAGKVIDIYHHYTPVVGSMVPSPQTIADINRLFKDRTPPYTPMWNRDPAGLIQANPELIYHAPGGLSNPQSNTEGPRLCVIQSWVLYRLTTGAYWNGGIGVFNLVINDQAGAPFAVNQFYRPTDNVQTKTSKYQASYKINHFVPTQDLLVLFLSLPQTGADFKSCGMP